MRTFLVLVSVLTLFSVHAYTDTDVISNVSIDGLRYVNPRSVLSVAKLKKGKCYSIVAANEDMRLILGMGCFDNVEFHFDDISGNLTFVVAEKPYIERIIFSGNSKISAENLKRVSVLKEKNYYDFSKLEETKEKINALYKDNGYADCSIEVYHATDANTSKMTITFLITENNRILVEEVKFEGIVFFKEKEILKLMNTKPGKVFNENVYQTDLQSIETFYKENGFIDCKIVSSSAMHNDVKVKILLTLNINEGSRYKIGSITYDGNSAVYNKEIEKIIKFKRNQIFNQDKIIEMVNDIGEFYCNRGHLEAKIVPHFNKEADVGIIDINLSIEEGLILYVKNIYIDGLISIRDKVIRRELLVKSGEVLTNWNLRRSIEKIYGLGFVNNVKYQVLVTDKPDVVDLIISVNEGNFGTVTGGIGYSLDNKLIITAQIQRMNIFGLGQKLKLNLSGGLYKKRLNYEIDWIEPWIFDKNISLNLTAFNLKENKNYGSVKKSKKIKTGYMAKINVKINDYMSLLFGCVYKNFNLSSSKTKIVKDLNLKKPIKTLTVFNQFVHDSRNCTFNPSRGSIHTADLAITSILFGGDINLVKGFVKSSWFFPTFWKFVLSINLYSGIIIPYGQSGILTHNIFYLDGSDTVRGYTVIPKIKSSKDGMVMGLMNIEYKFPMVFNEEKEFIQGTMFCDVIGGWESYSGINLDFKSKSENVCLVIGFGAKIMIPMFPLKIEWRYGLNHEIEKNPHRFYFSFGDN